MNKHMNQQSPPDAAQTPDGIHNPAQAEAMDQGATAGGSNAKKVYIKTYGCQMNVYDSARMADALAQSGYEPTEAPETADLVVLNTCHIREKAAEKVYSELGRLRQLRTSREAQGGHMMIGVAGCVAQAEGEEIISRSGVVDLVVGPQSYHRLPGLIEQARNAPVVDTEFPAEDKFSALPRPTQEATIARGLTAFLTVQEGCDKFCTFCVVPYTRGAEVSRPVAQIVAEAEALVEAGVREITLLGQNVNAYHGVAETGQQVGLGTLIARLAQIPALARLRYTTSHPRDMDAQLIAMHGAEQKLMPYLHLPVQSGSDKILKAMNRHHDRASYLQTIAQIRQARPDIALSGDFIVGFPGETDADFAETMDLVRAVNYASAFSFKYSPRPGTPGAELGDQVAEETKNQRLYQLQDLLGAQQEAFNGSCVGRVLPVLLERVGRNAGYLSGRSPYLQTVHIEAEASQIGTIVPVEIQSAGKNSLLGKIVTLESD